MQAALTNPGPMAVRAAPPRNQRNRLPPLLAPVAALAAWVNFNVVWNQFYRGVPALFDTAWYAHLVFRSAPILKNPAAVRFGTIGPDFFATHFSPLLWILSWPSWLVPLQPVEWLAILEASKCLLVVAAIWMALRAIADRANSFSTAQSFGAAAVLLLGTFNGPLLACIAYPHFETWFLPAALAFLVALFTRRIPSAVMFFGLALLVREDIGLHLAGLLLVAAVARRLTSGNWPRAWLVFACAGLIWSTCALLLIHRVFPGDSAFQRVYIGDPPFAQIRINVLTRRLAIYAGQRAYLWLPAVAYVLWALWTRAWWVLLGFIAFIPWALLNFFARSDGAATLNLYYVFPYTLALLWPLAGWLAFGNHTHRSGPDLCWMAAGLTLSIFGFFRSIPDDVNFVRDALIPQTGTRGALHSTAVRLVAARASGAAVGVDGATAALAPDSFDNHNLYWQCPDQLDFTAFFANGRMVDFGWSQLLRLPHRYAVEGTPLVVGSVRPLNWPDLVPLDPSTAPTHPGASSARAPASR